MEDHLNNRGMCTSSGRFQKLRVSVRLFLWLSVDQKWRTVDGCRGSNCTEYVLVLMTSRSVDGLYMNFIKILHFQTGYADPVIDSTYCIHAVQIHAVCTMLL